MIISPDDKKISLPYQPSKEEEEMAWEVLNHYSEARTARLQTEPYLNDRSLMQYVNDCVSRVNGYVPPRQNEAEWRSRYFSKKPRQKLMAIAAKIAANNIRAQFSVYDNGQEHEDSVIYLQQQVINDLYNASLDRDNFDRKQFDAIFELGVKGTAFIYEGFNKEKITYRNITEFEPQEGKVKWETKTEVKADVYSEVVPMEKMLIGNFYEADIQKQPYLIWEETITYDQAERMYGGWKNFNKVPQYQDAEGDIAVRNFFEAYFPRVQGNKVRFLRYYNRSKDRIIMMMNGVILGSEMPFPWNHKQYPFSVAVYERYAKNYFYGMSLIEKIRGDIDVLNALQNMIVDQTLLSIYPLTIVNQEEEITNFSMEPGLIYRTSAENVANSFTQFQQNPPPRTALTIREMVSQDIDELSIDEVAMGINTGKGTATEAQLASEAASQMLTPLLMQVGWLVRDSAIQRVQNIMQFYTDKDMLKELPSKDVPLLKRFFSSFVVENETLKTGKNGRRIIRFTDEEVLQELSGGEDIERVESALSDMGKPTEMVYVKPDFIRNLSFHVNTLYARSLRPTESLKKALELEWFGVINGDPMFNQVEARKDLSRVFDKDPMRVMQTTPPEPDMGLPPMGMGGEAPSMPQNTPLVNDMLGQGQVRESMPSRIVGGMRVR